MQIKDAHRPLLAKVLIEQPETRKLFKILKRMGVEKMYPDYRYDRQPDGGYAHSLDVEAWNAVCRNGIFVCMLRKDGEWFLHS